jgi:hypothetical protein
MSLLVAKQRFANNLGTIPSYENQSLDFIVDYLKINFTHPHSKL